jgi:peptidoglycan/LPS O-acetylase OafA/YrhL
MEDEQPTAAEVQSADALAGATAPSSSGGEKTTTAEDARAGAGVPRGVSGQRRRRRARITSIDALRGVAALCVMLWHYTNYVAFARGSVWQMRLGYLGVDLFFVISGFVIFMTVEGASTVRDFAFARFTRLYPTFFLATILLYAIWWAATANGINGCVEPGPPPSWGQFFLNLTMLGGFFENAWGDFHFVVSSAWTLAYECSFYFWVGLLFATGQLRRWQPIMLVWMALEVIMDQAVLWPSGFHWTYVLSVFFLFDYVHLFAAGMALYALFRRYGHPPEDDEAYDDEPTIWQQWFGRMLTPPLPSKAGEQTPLLSASSVAHGPSEHGAVSAAPTPAPATQPDVASKAAEDEDKAKALALSGALAHIVSFLRASWPELLILLIAFLIATLDKSPWGSGRRYTHWQLIHPMFCVCVYSVFALIICVHRWRGRVRVLEVVGSAMEKEYVVFFGTVSYAVYLVHEETGYFLIQGLHGSDDPTCTFPPLFHTSPPWNPAGTICFVMLAALLFGTLITYLYEQPVMERMRRWYKRRQTARRRSTLVTGATSESATTTLRLPADASAHAAVA